LTDVASSSKEDDLARKRQWRISPEEMGLLRETSKLFEGTVSSLFLPLIVVIEYGCCGTTSIISTTSQLGEIFAIEATSGT
jgi:hypothetical protein